MKNLKKRGIIGIFGLVLACALMLGVCVGSAVGKGSKSDEITVPVNTGNTLAVAAVGSSDIVLRGIEGNLAPYRFLWDRAESTESLPKSPNDAQFVADGELSAPKGTVLLGGRILTDSWFDLARHARMFMLSSTVASGTDVALSEATADNPGKDAFNEEKDVNTLSDSVEKTAANVSGSDAAAVIANNDISLTADEGETPELTVADSIDLKIVQYKQSICDTVGTVTVTDKSTGTVVGSSETTEIKTFAGVLGDILKDAEGNSYYPEDEFTVTITAPEGHFIYSVAATTASALKADASYSIKDTTRTYTLSGHTKDQTITVRYVTGSFTLKQINAASTYVGAASAAVTLNVENGTVKGSDSYAIASAKVSSSGTGSAVSLLDGTRLVSLAVDSDKMADGYVINKIKVTKDGAAWDVLTLDSPIKAGTGIHTLSFSMQAVATSDTEAADVVIELTYEPIESIVTITHVNPFNSNLSSYTRASVGLTVSGGTVQDGSTSITLPGNTSALRYTVSEGAQLKSLSLGGNVFDTATRLVVSDVSVYKNGAKWNVLESAEYPIEDPATLNFISGTVMPSDNIEIVITYDEVEFDTTLTVEQVKGSGTVAVTMAKTELINGTGGTALSSVSAAGSGKKIYNLYDNDGDGTVTVRSFKVTPEKGYEIGNVKLLVGGVDCTDSLSQSVSGSTITYTYGIAGAADEDVYFLVNYDSWGKVIVRHSYEAGSDASAPLGRLMLYAKQTNTFIAAAGITNSYIEVSSQIGSNQSFVTPGKAVGYLNIDQPSKASVVKVTATLVNKENGTTQDVSNMLIWPDSYGVTGSIRIDIDNCVPEPNTEIIFDVTYGQWNSYVTVNHSYEAGSDAAAPLGRVMLYAAATDTFTAGAGVTGTYMEVSSQNSSNSALARPGKAISHINIDQPSKSSLLDVKAKLIDRKTGKSEDITDKLVWPETFDVVGQIRLEIEDCVIATNTEIIFDVTYGQWNSYVTVNHSYEAGSDASAPLGRVMLYAAATDTFTAAGTGGVTGTYMELLSQNSSNRALARPGKAISHINIDQPSKSSLLDVKATLINKKTGVSEDITDKLVWPETFDVVGQIRLEIEDCVIVPNTEIVIDVIYGQWNSYVTVNHSYAEGEDDTNGLGRVMLYAAATDTFTAGAGVTGTYMELSSQNSSNSALARPGKAISHININQPSKSSLLDVKAKLIDRKTGKSEDITDKLVWPETFDVVGQIRLEIEDCVIAAHTEIVIDVTYGEWDSYVTVNHSYADGEDASGGLGRVMLYAASRDTFRAGAGVTSTYIEVSSQNSSNSALARPGKAISHINIDQPSKSSLLDVKAKLIDRKTGKSEDITDKLVWPETFDVVGQIRLEIEDCVIASHTEIVIDVTYGQWDSYVTVNHSYADGEDASGGLGRVMLYAASRDTFRAGAGVTGTYMEVSSQNSSNSALARPGKAISHINIDQPSKSSLLDVKAKLIDRKTGKSEDITDKLVWPETFDVVGQIRLEIEDCVIAAHTEIVIDVTYGEWDSYVTVNHSYADGEDASGGLGRVMLYAASRDTFRAGAGVTGTYMELLSQNSSNRALARPGKAISHLNIDQPSKSSLLDVKATLINKKTGVSEDITDKLVWPETFDVVGQIRLEIEDCVIAAHTEIVIDVTYGEWDSYVTVNHSYADGEDASGGLGRVMLYAASRDTFRAGAGVTSTYIEVSSQNSSNSALARPGKAISHININQPSKSSLLDVKAKLIDRKTGKSEDITDKLVWPETFDVVGQIRLEIEDCVIAAHTEIVIDVTYGQWDSYVTVNHSYADGEDASGGLGRVMLYAASRDTFRAGAGVTGTYMELSSRNSSNSALARPGKAISHINIDQPSNSSLLDVKAKLIDRKTGKSEDITDKLVWPETFDVVGQIRLEIEDCVIAAHTEIVIDVTYGEWDSYVIVNQSYADDMENAPAALGTVYLYASESKTFIAGANVTNRYINLGSSNTTNKALARPGKTLGQLTVNQPSKYPIAEIKVSLVDKKNNTTKDITDRLVWPDDFTPVGQETFKFNDCVIASHTDIVVDIVYSAYTVTWIDGDGNTLKTEQYGYGEMPAYNGATPTKTATEQYTYTFNNKWSPEIVAVTEDAAYTAQFDTETVTYDVTALKNGEGSVNLTCDKVSIELTEAAQNVVKAEVGANVSFTVTAEDGCEITDVNASGAVITANSDGSYSFVMPANGVEITVTAAKSADKPQIEILKSGDGDASAAYGSEVLKLTEQPQIIAANLEAGDYGFIITAAEGCTILSVNVDGTFIAPDPDDSSKYIVTVGDEKVTVVVDMRRNPIISVERIGLGEVFTNGVTQNVSGKSWQVDYNSDHSFDFVPYEGERLLSITVKRGSEAAQLIYSGGQSGSSEGRVLAESVFTYMLADVTENCVITANFTEPESYKLHVIKKGAGKGSFVLGSDKHTDSFTVEIDAGSTPQLTIKADNGHKITSVKMGASEADAQPVKLENYVLNIPAVHGDVYVIAELEQIGTSGGSTTPDTGDSSALIFIAANLFVVSALVCTVCVMHRRRINKEI